VDRWNVDVSRYKRKMLGGLYTNWTACSEEPKSTCVYVDNDDDDDNNKKNNK